MEIFIKVLGVVTARDLPGMRRCYRAWEEVPGFLELCYGLLKGGSRHFLPHQFLLGEQLAINALPPVTLERFPLTFRALAERVNRPFSNVFFFFAEALILTSRFCTHYPKIVGCCLKVCGRLENISFRLT